MRLIQRFMLLAVTLGALVGLVAGPALAAGTGALKFSASGGSYARWNSDHTAVDLHVAAADGYAAATLMGVGATRRLPDTAPSLAATGYAAGTPRLVIAMDDGTYVFGYPTNSGDNAAGLFESPKTSGYVQWSDILAAYGTTKVSDVYVVADGSQATPYTASVTSLQYNGKVYIP